MAELLSQDDRAEILRMFTEMKTGYKNLNDLIAESKPTGEIKIKLEKIDQSLMDFHAKHEAAGKKLEAVELAINERASKFEPPKSIGQRAIEDAGLVAAIKTGSRFSYTVQLKNASLADMQLKDITGVGLLLPQTLDRIAIGPQLPYGVRTLIPSGRTTAGAVQYLREATFTNSAAPVAEGQAKPKSDKTFLEQNAPVQTIAHYFKISKQTFEDMPAVAALIDTQGVYGVKIKEDNQLLNGNGVSPQLQGFLPVAAAAPAVVATDSLVDALGLAVFDLAAKGYIPDGSVVNPADWGKVAMQKNAQGLYMFANPMDYSPNNRIWGTRLVMTSNMAARNYLVGAFQGNSLLLDREEVNVQVATQNEDDFIRNMYTVLIEERLVNLIFVTTAFEKGAIPLTLMAAAEEPESTGGQRRK